MYENIIVIPYRNREKHLEYFITNTVPLIQRYLPNSKIVVVEQNEGKLFNRGALLNVAFREYKNKTKYFFTHDVDINPTLECIKDYYMREVDEVDVMGIYTSQANTLGGIIKIQDSTIHKINGFPNDIWGWGSEDKALQNRVEYYQIKKEENLTNKEEHPNFLLRFNDVDDRIRSNYHINHNKQYNQFKHLSKEQKLEVIMSSGLNNLKYTIVERRMVHDIVEIIKVDI